MKLKALDQISISSVRPDSIRPGETFEVSDAAGEELLKRHPKILQRAEGEAVQEKAEPAPLNKADELPLNKEAEAPKASTRRKLAKDDNE